MQLKKGVYNNTLRVMQYQTQDTNQDQTSNQQASGEQTKKKHNWFTILLMVGLGLIFLFILGQSNLFSGSKSSISGTVNFSGLKPQDDSGEIGRLVLLQRQFGAGQEFIATDAEVELKDGASWHFNEAAEGTTYELRIDLYANDEFVKSSNVITSTAPASGQILDLNVTLSDLPDSVISETEVEISGRVDINGYVPAGSRVYILQREKGASDYELATDEIQVSDNAKWVWDTANPGVEYDIKGVLAEGENIIGESNSVRVVAPDSGVLVTISSDAQPPVTEKPATISGTIQLNGAVKNNSNVLIQQRAPGATDFTTVQTIPAVNGASFSWSTAIEGQRYEITGVLMEGETRISQGNVLNLTAPASDELIIIDTKLTLSAPKDKPRVTCKEQFDNGTWEADITFPRIADAKKYYQQAGTEQGGDDIVSNVVDNTNPNEDVKATVTVKDGKNTYTRYAYTYCSNCDVSDTSNWSDFSPTTIFACSSDNPDKQSN